MFRLREIRKEKGMSQQQLANRLGVTQAALSGWETEKFEIDKASLLKCSEIFNVSTDYLLGNEKTLSGNDNKEKPSENTDSLSYKIIEVFNRLDEEKQNTVLAYAEFLASQNNQEK